MTYTERPCGCPDAEPHLADCPMRTGRQLGRLVCPSCGVTLPRITARTPWHARARAHRLIAQHAPRADLTHRPLAA